MCSFFSIQSRFYATYHLLLFVLCSLTHPVPQFHSLLPYCEFYSVHRIVYVCKKNFPTLFPVIITNVLSSTYLHQHFIDDLNGLGAFFSRKSMNMSAIIGEMGNPMATPPSFCWYILPSNLKYVLVRRNSTSFMISSTDNRVLSFRSLSSSSLVFSASITI
uniref:Secreted protein n=1 Tax=Trichobilharzia regenti TaxID=157069 RepID=A0AA85J2H0_TRIRE|nr:unnamed protein product [Trichobilharzia regenti]